jgi:hypothetical protein
MIRRRWLRPLLAAALGLASAVSVATGPAGAAPCTVVTCVRYYADITIAATILPWWPIAPGDLHSYTVQVTNTGWRVSGLSAPTPAPGPASGQAWVCFHEPVGEMPIHETNDFGVTFHVGGTSHICYGADSLPTNTTSQFTFAWRAPTTPGTYTMTLIVDSYKWTEYDENNNTVVMNYVVA